LDDNFGKLQSFWAFWTIIYAHKLLCITL
jgi:hypothetical protein